MKRALAAISVTATVLAALPFVPDVASAAAPTRARAGDAPAAVEPRDEDRVGTWIGTIEGGDVAIAVISDGKIVRAYACDGDAVSSWFEGELIGDSFAITAPDGSTITGALSNGSATGVFTSTDAPIAGAFTAQRPTGSGGVFRSYFVTEDQAAVFIRWIVFDDGTQRGNAETTAAPAPGALPQPPATTPAPPLSVPAATTEQSAPVGPAGAPAPVTQLTPTSIAAAVPTTVVAGAPPPIPPPAPPPVQPLTVATTVNPAKADVGTPVRYQLALTNPNPTALANAGVRVGLPPALAVAPSTDKSSCKGSFVTFPPGTTKPGQPSIVVSGVALGPGASCTAEVDIVASAPVAVDVVTNAPTADGTPPGTPAKATFVLGSSVAAPAAAPVTTTPTTKPSTTTTKPGTTATTKPSTSTTKPSTTTTTTSAPPTTTTKPSTTTTTTTPPTTTTAPRASTTAVVPTVPSQPDLVEARALPLSPGAGPNDGRVEITFLEPTFNGGSVIVSYAVSCALVGGFGGGPPGPTGDGRDSPIRLSGFALDATYVCSVAAVNFDGEVGPSTVTNPVIVRGPTTPSPPRQVRAQALPLGPGDGPDAGRVEVSFLPPASDGGSPIINFGVSCVTPLGPERFDGGPSSPVVVTGLTVDREYACSVDAINSEGGQSAAAPAIPVTVRARGAPSPPRNANARPLALRSTDGPFDGRVEVTFDPPADTGGSVIVNFGVTCFSGADPGGAVPGPFEGPFNGGPSSPIIVSGFLVDDEYTCTVDAFNADGAQSPAATTNTVTVRSPGAPSPPRVVETRVLPLRSTDTPFDGRVEITYDDPKTTGGAPIVAVEAVCEVLPTPGGDPGQQVKGGGSSPIVVKGLTVDEEYFCTLVAINALARASAPAFAGSVTVPGRGAPTAPRNVQARALPLRAGDDPATGGRVEFTFDPPADDGGALIVTFGVTCSAGSAFGGGSPGPFDGGPTSPITLSGFVVGVEYACAVDAFNADGAQSPAASANPVTVLGQGAPTAPRNFEARPLPLRAGDDPATGGRVEFTFDPPVDDGGAPIVTFGVFCAAGSAFGGGSPGPFDGGPTSPIALTGFSVGVEYTCTVDAFNAEGGQSPTARTTVTMSGAGRPSAPRNVKARPLPLRAADDPKTGGRVEFTFDPPADDGGDPVALFSISCSAGSAFGGGAPGPFNLSESSPVTLTDFVVGVEYTCAVDAVTKLGGASPSVQVKVTVPEPGTKPSAPSTPTTRPSTSTSLPPTTTTTAPKPTKALSLPTAPREVVARALPLGNGGVTGGRIDVGFVDPADDGGSPIKTFSALCSTPIPTPVGSPTLTTNLVAAGSGSASPVTVTGIQVDLPYTCSVTAITEAELESPAGFAVKPVTVAGRPGPPRNVEARALPLGSAGPQDGRAEVSFDEPVENGAPPVTGFVARCETRLPAPRPGEFATTLVAEGFGSTSPVTVEGLTVDFSYDCSAAAINQIGEGRGIRATPIAVQGHAGPVTEVVARPLPLGPTDGTLDGRVEVTFTAAEDGPTPDEFRVRCQGGTLEKPVEAAASGRSSPVTVPGLELDRSYTCGVHPTNQIGEGLAAFAKPVVVRGKPGRPRDVQANALPLRAGDGPDGGRVELTFAPPEDNGSPEVTAFSGRCTSPTTTAAGVPTNLTAVEFGAKSSPLTVTGLRIDAEYRCTVAATNRIGEGGETLASKPVTVTSAAQPETTTTTVPSTTTTVPTNATTPAAPPPPSAFALPPEPTDGLNDGRVTVEFDRPGQDGGAPIIGFVATCAANPTTTFAATGTQSPITVPEMLAGFRYRCFVQAENAIGVGTQSALSNEVALPIPPSVQQPPSKPPGRPIATANPPQKDDGPNDGQITVEFFESEQDGGSKITGYIVTCANEGLVSERKNGTESPVTVSGLQYGSRYTCVVEAENDFGVSDPSRSSNSVLLPLPPSVLREPSRPRNVVADPQPPQAGAGLSDGQIVVRFDAPESDGGSPVTSFEVLCSDNDVIGETRTGDESPITVTDLTPGNYLCGVRAVNDQGPSDLSRAPAVTVLAPPSEPRLAAAPVSGAAPLATAFTLEDPPAKIGAWTIDFGDGTPKVQGDGPIPALPHTFLNKTSQATTFNASLTVATGSAKPQVLTRSIEVHPPGTTLTLDSKASPNTFQRGGEGAVALTLRNPNAAQLDGPLTISVGASTKAALVGTGWECGESSCTLESDLPGFAAAPVLVANLAAPLDAPASFEVPFESSAGAARLATVVRIPVVGVVANAGPDQTVDATTPQPDGTLAPTNVLLDAGASLGLDGKNQQFKWRQASGTPQVTLDTKVDPTNRVVTFDAPSVPSQRALDFELTVTQGSNVSKDTVRVTVFPRNQPPVLQKINVSGLTTKTRSSGEVVPEGQGTLKLTRDASDPDGDALNTTWRVLTSGVPKPTGAGETFSLDWPVPGVPQVVVEATVTDQRGATGTATVTLGTAPNPLGLEVAMPARVDAGEPVSAQATPSRTSGVQVQWGLVSGPTIAGFPKSGRSISFDAPAVSTTQIVTLAVTATEPTSGASATRQVSVEVDGPPPLVVSSPPSVSVDPGAQASVEATVVGGSNPTFDWQQTFGPNVSLTGDDARTVRFVAPDTSTTIGLRLRVTAAGVTRTADTIVTVGEAAATPASGCGDGSAYQQLANGGTVVFAGIAVLSGVTAQGSNASCDEATLDGVDVNLLDGLVIGDGLSGTFDQGGIQFTGGDVRLPDAFQLPPIDLGSNPLTFTFDGGGAGGTTPGGTPPGGAGGGPTCIDLAADFASRDFPFVPLPPGFSSGGASLAIGCANASISAEATADGATFAIDADLADGGAAATVTLTDVPALGGTASGAGTINVAPGGAPTYDLTATIENPSLPVPGIVLDAASARLTPEGLTVSASGTLGEGSGALAVTMEGAFAETGLSLAVDASNAGPWEVGPELSVDAANLVGTIDVDAAGAATVDLRLSVGGDWRPAPGLKVRQLSLQVANTAVPDECAIPVGGLWVRASGEGAIEIPGVSPLALAVEACLGPPTDAGTPAFSLRSTVGGPQWQVADGVVIRDVGIQVTLVGDTLTLQASGGATLLGLDLTARVLFLLPTGAGQPTVLVDAAGSLAGLGVPITSGHVVFASAAVPDFEVEPGLTLDIPQGITGIGSIDLGQPIADLLNEAFSPPTPILPRVTVTLSFGAAIEIKAAINLGGEGATLFLGCEGGGTACSPTAPTTTRLALESAFIRLVLGGSGGFSIGFGGDGSLNLPPAEAGGLASPLDLHVEASIQPPARVGLALFFEGAWQNAMGLSGLTLSNLGIQGSIDFSTTPIPTVTMGITGQVDHVPNQLADVLGLSNNGEPQRFTVNVDPLAPILELTLGVDDGAIVMRPLTAVGQPDALEVDFASIVVAPFGGIVGPVTYSQGVSAGFGANILDVPVHVNATVDIAAAHINGTVEVGTLTVGGVQFEDTTVLLDITPQRFRQTLCGGVHVGSTTLQGLLHVQAGSNGGGPATCNGVSLTPTGAGAGLRARFRLNAESLPVGPVSVQQLNVDAQANLDALSANFDATLNATAKLSVLANNLDVNGTIKFGNGTLQELHVKALGNVNVAGVQITGTGSCPFGPGGGGAGACVQLDHAPATSTPFRFGLKGKLNAAGSTASVTGSLDPQRATLEGTLQVPTLGTLDVSGTLVYAGGGTIANATGANVSANPGDWRVSGQFATPKALAGNVSAAWAFAAGRVSSGIFLRGSADTSIGGATVQLAGTFSASSSGALTYSLTGSSNGSVSGTTVGLGLTGAGALNPLHDAIRLGVFAFPGLAPIGDRPSDENFPERMRGRMHFDASYDLSVTLSQNGLDIDEADIAAKVVYGERFDRDGNGTFGEETAGNRNTLVNFNLDASGIDEFFEMSVAQAATRTQAATFCFELFGEPFGAC